MLRLAFIFFLTLSASNAGADTGNQGFIYGSVVTDRGDTLTGFLRWDNEEACWDQLFHSYREDIPWLEEIDTDLVKKEREKAYFESHGLLDRVIYALHNDGEPDFRRVFICRFGDLARLDQDDEETLTATTNDGRVHLIGGYSNDVTADLRIYDGPDYEEVEFEDMRAVIFRQAPPEVVPYAGRLAGTVHTTEGDFTGFIQWDKSECVSTDLLDGDDPDGRDHEIPMGDIVRIATHGKKASEVTLTDGRVLVLDGTNDVNHQNRGIMVEVAELGSVTVPWSRFEAVDFAPAGSGPARADYPAPRPLTGAVTTTDGRTLRGGLVLNFNEAFTWDIFNGTISRLEYDLPMGRVLSVENRGDQGARVTLAGGRKLDLAESGDTGTDHMGALVYTSDAREPEYVPWRLVDRVDLDQ